MCSYLPIGVLYRYERPDIFSAPCRKNVLFTRSGRTLTSSTTTTLLRTTNPTSTTNTTRVVRASYCGTMGEVCVCAAVRYPCVDVRGVVLVPWCWCVLLCGMQCVWLRSYCLLAILLPCCCYRWNESPAGRIAVVRRRVVVPACASQFCLGCVPGSPMGRHGYGACDRLPQVGRMCPAGPCSAVAVEPRCFDVVVGRVVPAVGHVAREVVVFFAVAPSPPPPVGCQHYGVEPVSSHGARPAVLRIAFVLAYMILL